MALDHVVTRDDCVHMDADDPLAPHRAQFDLPVGVINLNGNSLGALPRETSTRVREVVEAEWGQGLIRSWHTARWLDLPRRVGAKIARLVGAETDEVICADSTSVNLVKVLATALRMQTARPQVSVAERRVIVSEKSNFPTDLYIAQGLLYLLGDRYELKLAEFDGVSSAIDQRTAIVML